MARSDSKQRFWKRSNRQQEKAKSGEERCRGAPEHLCCWEKASAEAAVAVMRWVGLDLVRERASGAQTENRLLVAHTYDCRRPEATLFL